MYANRSPCLIGQHQFAGLGDAKVTIPGLENNWGLDNFPVLPNFISDLTSNRATPLSILHARLSTLLFFADNVANESSAHCDNTFLIFHALRSLVAPSDEYQTYRRHLHHPQTAAHFSLRQNTLVAWTVYARVISPQHRVSNSATTHAWCPPSSTTRDMMVGVRRTR